VKILDTCFLIHLHREWAKNRPGPAMDYLEREKNEDFSISVVTVLEFLEGYANPADGRRFLEPFPSLPVTEEVAGIASRIRRGLRQRGEMIGDFDILIAATALHADLPLVTDYARHFHRIENLAVESYRNS
jgi:predicted nucleic acid-binding protein